MCSSVVGPKLPRTEVHVECRPLRQLAVIPIDIVNIIHYVYGYTMHCRPTGVDTGVNPLTFTVAMWVQL